MLYIKALEFYQNNIKNAEEKIIQLDKKISLIGWIRLLIVIVFLLVGYHFYKLDNVLFLILGEILVLGTFGLVVAYHSKLNDRKRKHAIFIDINQKGLGRLNGDFKKIEDVGEEYINEKHSFSYDLDIFGKSSLFSLINDTTTKGGRDRLAKELTLESLPPTDLIKEKSKGIQELGEKVKWRQKLRVFGLFNFKNTDEEFNEVENIKEFGKSTFKSGSYKKLIAYIFILINFCSIAAVLLGYLGGTNLILVFMLDYIVVRRLTGSLKEEIFILTELKNIIKIYANAIEMIENEEFESSYINNLKNKLKDKDGNSATKEMKKLVSLSEWVGDSENNAFYLILNILFFMDIFILDNLSDWKEKNGEKLEKWLDVVNEVDALSSISNLYFDFDTWIRPEIVNEKVVVAKEIGHPLLGEKAVRNNYSLDNGKMTTLITGSNMSGKSTFLRTVGLNLILSYIGAPVFAKEFKCGRFNVSTCMRTKDNLEENTSSFYAEILRIKLLIEKTEKGEDVFFLLDEIFKGTNSKDRHIGAKELIAQLMRGGAMGIVSTHDLELCDLEKDDKRIENYNFREYYENNKIKFDYKLRKGRSETQNAIHLMKLAGIKF